MYVKLFIYICWTLKKYIDTVYKYKLASERYFQCVHNVWDFISIKYSESQFGTCIKNLKVCALKYTCISSRRKNFIRGNHGEYLVPPLLWLCSSSGKLKFPNGKLCLNFASKEYLIREKSDTRNFFLRYRDVNFLSNFIILSLEEYIIRNRMWKCCFRIIRSFYIYFLNVELMLPYVEKCNSFLPIS